MQEEILKLIYDYALNYKTPDNNFISKIVDLVVNKKDLNQYISKVKINCATLNNPFTLATYYPLLKTIELYKEKIKNYMNILLKYKRFSSDFERNIFILEFTTLILLHELEHALQEKKINTSYDLESRLYFFDYQVELITKFDEYKSELYYNYSIKERVAKINSNEAMLGILNPLNNDIPIIIQDLKQDLKYLYKFAYYDFFFEKGDNSPTLKMLNLGKEAPFYKNLEYRYFLRKLKWYNADYFKCLEKIKYYSFAERFYLGLPITEEEFLKVDEYLENQLILKI